jgi:surface polysaccharide O-acyltransferase-like enzyme
MAYNFFVTLFDNGTVLFVFIAGFLFQHLNHDHFNIRRYWFQKSKFVLLPYVIISIPIILFRLKFGVGELPLPNHFDTNPILYKIFFYLLTGLHMVPFWFMPMIFLIYLSTPVLHALDNRKFYTYFFPLIFIAGMFTYRATNNANPFLSYLHFIPIYITGMWASFYKEKVLAHINKLLFPLLLIYLTISTLELTEVITLDKKLSFEEVADNQLLIFNIYVFKAVVLCFILLMVFYKLRDKNINLLVLLGDYSFGIYFLHFYFISFFRETFHQMGIPFKFSTINFIGFYLMILSLSVTAVFVIKKITGKYSRYIIGS